MSEAIDREALDILRRIEPQLVLIQVSLAEKPTRVEFDRLRESESTMRAVQSGHTAMLASLATKDDVSKLGFSLTWRLIMLMVVVLGLHFAAMWWLVSHVGKLGG